MKRFLFVFLSLFLISCTLESNEEKFTEIEAPAEIVNRAFKFAEIYEESDTKYLLGGQDAARAIYIDCSGLVVMSYKYAMVDTKYQLLVSDMTSNYMYKNASKIIDVNNAIQGDLIFMGESDSAEVTHIAMFDHLENGIVYFIDSTKKDDIDGVSRRSYSVDDKRFKAFGRMRIKY